MFFGYPCFSFATDEHRVNTIFGLNFFTKGASNDAYSNPKMNHMSTPIRIDNEMVSLFVGLDF